MCNMLMCEWNSLDFKEIDLKNIREIIQYMYIFIYFQKYGWLEIVFKKNIVFKVLFSKIQLAIFTIQNITLF